MRAMRLGEIGEADDRDAVTLDDLAGLGERAVAALLGRQVDDDRAAASSRSTTSSGTSIGAVLPGMSAVVMMMSTSAACARKSAISAAMNASLISFA